MGGKDGLQKHQTLSFQFAPLTYALGMKAFHEMKKHRKRYKIQESVMYRRE